MVIKKIDRYFLLLIKLMNFYIYTTGIFNNDGINHYVDLYLDILLPNYTQKILNNGFTNIIHTHYECRLLYNKCQSLVKKLENSGHIVVSRYFNPMVDKINDNPNNYLVVDFAHLFIYTKTPKLVIWNSGSENNLNLNGQTFILNTLYVDYLAQYKLDTPNIKYCLDLLKNGFEIIDGELRIFTEYLKLKDDDTIEGLQRDRCGQLVGIGYGLYNKGYQKI